jgi:hypothetical protein
MPRFLGVVSGVADSDMIYAQECIMTRKVLFAGGPMKCKAEAAVEAAARRGW